MPPLVRRRPLLERIQAYLDPVDFLLFVSEELNDDAHEELLNNWATPIGITLNAVFIIAKGASQPDESEDVFGEFDGSKSSGWFAWTAAFLVHALTVLCCLNAFYAFFRKRHYRLFEQPVDLRPNTPSAQRVRVDSSPASSSPVSYIKKAISAATAPPRAHPDPERDVWEVSVWDPKPFHLTTFTLFSPGHVLLYRALLPTMSLDSRHSVAVLFAIVFGAILSLQLVFMKSSFTQQAKDSALIHGEVMNEYDTKFVHPFLTRPVRDVGTQSYESSLAQRDTRVREVDLYTPTTLINRGFRTNPNPNYASQYDPDDLASKPDPRNEPRQSLPRSTTKSSLATPKNYVSAYTQLSTAQHSSSNYSSPLQPRYEPPRGGPANSPLRKVTSIDNIQSGRRSGDEFARGTSARKRMSTAAGTSTGETPRDERRRQTGRF